MKKIGISADRFNSLKDAVIAIVLTLLILDLKFQDWPSILSNIELLKYLKNLFPIFFAYILSFLIIAKYWQLHTIILNKANILDKNLLWLNLVYLLCISFLPIPSGIIGRYYNIVAISLFDISLCLPGIFIYFIIRYMLNHKDLFEVEFSKSFMNSLLLVPVACFMSILVAFIEPSLSLLPWIIIFFKKYFWEVSTS